MNGEWFPGHHEALITPGVLSAATRCRTKGRPKGKDLLSGKVRCGMCQRLMALDQNGGGRKMYRCKHCGQGCAQPRRTNVGLLRAAVLGLQFIGDDEQLQHAIRRSPLPQRSGRPGRATSKAAAAVIGADLFAEEEARLAGAVKAAQCESEAAQAQADRSVDVARHFDDVAQMLAALDIQRTWAAANDAERRVLLDEFLEDITVLPDYMNVNVHGAPSIHVLYQEVGLKESGPDRVGGGSRNNALRPFDTNPTWGSSQVGGRIDGNSSREVGTTRSVAPRCLKLSPRSTMSSPVPALLPAVFADPLGLATEPPRDSRSAGLPEVYPQFIFRLPWSG
jgi:hypothetical protein